MDEDETVIVKTKGRKRRVVDSEEEHNVDNNENNNNNQNTVDLTHLDDEEIRPSHSQPRKSSKLQMDSIHNSLYSQDDEYF